jgi:hypothetical protein
METTRVSLRTVIIAVFIVGKLRTCYEWQIHFGDRSPRSPLRGIWNVDVLQDNGVVRPPLTTDSTRWRRLVFDDPQFGTIYDMDDTRHLFRAKVTRDRIALVTMDAKSALTLSYARPDPGTLVIGTTIGGHDVRAVCHRQDEKSFLLTSTHFQWSADYPNY